MSTFVTHSLFIVKYIIPIVPIIQYWSDDDDSDERNTVIIIRKSEAVMMIWWYCSADTLMMLLVSTVMLLPTVLLMPNDCTDDAVGDTILHLLFMKVPLIVILCDYVAI